LLTVQQTATSDIQNRQLMYNKL